MKKIFIFLLFLTSAAAYSQNQSIGFIQSEITSIDLSPETETSSTLIVNGDPISESFDYRVRRAEGTNNEFILELPNAIVDKEEFKSESLQFSDKIIESIEMKEVVNKENDLYTVTFTIKTRSPSVATTRLYNEKRIETSFVSISVPQGPVPVPELDENSERGDQLTYNPDDTPYFNADKFNKNFEPAALNVSIITAGASSKTAAEMAIFLNNVMKTEINKRIGMQLNVFQVSRDVARRQKTTTIYYRTNFIRPAMILADVIPKNQRIKRMIHPESKQGIHIEIYLGSDIR